MEKQRKVFLILGRTGEGKSTLARRIRTHFDRIITFDPQGEYDGDIVSSFEEFVEHLHPLFEDWQNEKFNIVCRMQSDIDVEDSLKLTRQLSNFLLVIEETEIYLNPRSPNQAVMEHIRYGRHKLVSLLCVARRSMELIIDLRSQASSIYTFKQIERHDLDVISDYGFNPETVMNLPTHEYAVIGEDFLREQKAKTVHA